MGGASIFDVHFGHRIGALTVRMHASLVNTDTGQHVRTGALHEMQIARMIDHTRKIGVLKIDPHCKQVLCAVEMALIGGGHGHREIC